MVNGIGTQEFRRGLLYIWSAFDGYGTRYLIVELNRVKGLDFCEPNCIRVLDGSVSEDGENEEYCFEYKSGNWELEIDTLWRELHFNNQ